MKFDHVPQHGWFVGSFDGAAYYSDTVEVCYRTEPAGPHPRHYHTKCTEILLIVRGEARIGHRQLCNGDFVILEPGEVNDIEYLVDSEIVCVKTPAGGQDKVLV